MGRMNTTNSDLQCPALAAGQAEESGQAQQSGTSRIPSGSPRALARQMAIEGAVMLGRLPVGSSSGGFGLEPSGPEEVGS